MGREEWSDDESKVLAAAWLGVHNQSELNRTQLRPDVRNKRLKTVFDEVIPIARPSGTYKDRKVCALISHWEVMAADMGKFQHSLKLAQHANLPGCDEDKLTRIAIGYHIASTPKPPIDESLSVCDPTMWKYYNAWNVVKDSTVLSFVPGQSEKPGVNPGQLRALPSRKSKESTANGLSMLFAAQSKVNNSSELIDGSRGSNKGLLSKANAEARPDAPRNDLSSQRSNQLASFRPTSSTSPQAPTMPTLDSGSNESTDGAREDILKNNQSIRTTALASENMHHGTFSKGVGGPSSRRNDSNDLSDTMVKYAEPSPRPPDKEDNPILVKQENCDESNKDRKRNAMLARLESDMEAMMKSHKRFQERSLKLQERSLQVQELNLFVRVCTLTGDKKDIKEARKRIRKICSESDKGKVWYI